MTKTVVGLFDTRPEAEQAVAALTAQGVSNADISIVANSKNDGTLNSVETTHGDGAATGAATGAIGGGVLGGTIGLLVGIGALAIPGIGPIIAAGPIAAALGAAGTTALVGAGIGAVSGGLLGALVGAGIPEEDANYYAEGVRRGGTLVMAKVDDSLAGGAYNVMQQYGAVDIDNRGGEWRGEGWDRFDPNGNEWDRSSKVGTAGGTAAGAATGAAIGSVGGPIGTVIGGVAGAAVGAATGAAGDAAGREAQDQAGTASTGVGTSTTPDYSRSTGTASTTYSRPVGNTEPVMTDTTSTTRRRGGRIYGDSGRYDIDEATGSTVPLAVASAGGMGGASAGSGSALGAAAVVAPGVIGNQARDYASGSGGSVSEDWKESSKVGTAGGAAAGAATGAAMGAVGGPVGAVIGGIAGAVTGAATGAAGDAAGEAAADATDENGNVIEREATNDVDGRKGQVKPRE